MKKCCIIFLMIFLILPMAFADISITTDQSIYNLGNKIKASASVMQNNNFEGLFRLTLSCWNYNLQYFLTPISLEQNFRTAVSIPELAATQSMLGDCTITGDLVTNDNLLVEEKVSNDFSVTDRLSVLPVRSKATALPGESIQIAGVINEAYGNNVLRASTKIGLEIDSYVIDIVDGKFNLDLEIPKNIKSGKHTIEISAYDQKNNVGSSSIELEITSVPSYLKTELSSSELSPGSTIDIAASIYDQADELINDSLNLELTSPKGSNVFIKVVNSNEKISYEFSQHAEPGLYVLTITYKDLLTQDFINITSIREIKVRYENESVVIENIGNIPFEDELTFFLESGSNKYPILKKINMEPGKIINIDLSKEVPLGIYNVLLPLKEGLGPIKEKINETIQNAVESVESLSSLLPEDENILAADVTIHDNRPIYKKIASSFAAVTGTLIGTRGLLSKNPIAAPMIIVIIVLLIVFRYGRKPIMRLIKRKKKDDKEDDEI